MRNPQRCVTTPERRTTIEYRCTHIIPYHNKLLGEQAQETRCGIFACRDWQYVAEGSLHTSTSKSPALGSRVHWIPFLAFSKLSLPGLMQCYLCSLSNWRVQRSSADAPHTEAAVQTVGRQLASCITLSAPYRKLVQWSAYAVCCSNTEG